MARERITSRKNAVILEVLKLSKDKHYRRSCGLLFAEGTKLLLDLLDSGVRMDTVIVSEGASAEIPEVEEARNILVPDDLFAAISTQKSPQGVIFTAKIPSEKVFDQGSYIVLDGVQDPGNVGTVIRTAAAFGMSGVVICGPTADPYSPKSVRASMGAVFRIPIYEYSPERLSQECSANDVTLLCAMPAGVSTDIRILTKRYIAVVIGNEGSGISQDMLNVSGGNITIPMSIGAESLNAAVAAAVVMWELMRGLL